MAVFVHCPACQNGEHDGHIEHWRTAPEGIIDGSYCPCKGDCKPPDLSRWLSAFAPSATIDDSIEGLRARCEVYRFMSDAASRDACVLLEHVDRLTERTRHT